MAGEVRKVGTRPLGVNLFVPEQDPSDPSARRLRRALAPAGRPAGRAAPEPGAYVDDEYPKLDHLTAHPVPLISLPGSACPPRTTSPGCDAGSAVVLDATSAGGGGGGGRLARTQMVCRASKRAGTGRPGRPAAAGDHHGRSPRRRAELTDLPSSPRAVAGRAKRRRPPRAGCRGRAGGHAVPHRSGGRHDPRTGSPAGRRPRGHRGSPRVLSGRAAPARCATASQTGWRRAGDRLPPRCTT
ncbi:hypothetical protein QJS66_13100 [Kocuria rhizophila]|nr:hypothetical protein QJS66_13100 [Kocuria rhizophila]